MLCGLCVQRPESVVGVVERVNSDVNVDVKQKIKEAILEDSKVTQRELVVKLGVSYRQIQQNMAEMVSGGEIVRVGSNRSGYWEIIE